MKVLTVDPSALRPSQLTPPLSKSDAHRALVLAHVTGSWPLPSLQDEPEHGLPSDVRVIRRGLELLRLPAGARRELDCADGGAPFRILVTQAAVTPGAHVRFVGTPRLGERPHQALFQSLLKTLGPTGLTLLRGDPWPVEVRSPRETGTPVFEVDGAQSSQYATSLLLGCAALAQREQRPWSVRQLGTVASAGYLELTVSWLERFGFSLSRVGDVITVSAGEPPRTPPALPGDWSSLGYLLLASWKTGGQVRRVDVESAHPDRALIRIVEGAGLHLVQSPDPSGASGPLARLEGTAERGVQASGTECPDLLPTLAALACVLPAPSTFTEVGVLRLKESDRLERMRALVTAFGGSSELDGERLTVVPPATAPAHFAFDSTEDHRMAMSAATLSVLSGARLSLTGPDCVAKSFPDFWSQLETAGVQLR